jgi:hypothetical protein
MITDILNTMGRMVGDIVNGSSSLAFISNLTSLSTLCVKPLTLDLAVLYVNQVASY